MRNGWEIYRSVDDMPRHSLSLCGSGGFVYIQFMLGMYNNRSENIPLTLSLALISLHELSK